MRFFISLFVILTLKFSFGFCQSSLPDNSEVLKAFVTDTDDFITKSMAELSIIPGVWVAVVRNGQTVYLRGFGKADLQTSMPVTPETTFYIASSTKSFVALTTVLLARDSEIDLDAPITRYLPAEKLPGEAGASRVTVRDLLTHTSGLENRAIVFRTAYSGQHSRELLLDLLSVTTVNNDAPHGTFAYTNLGYVLLGLILEDQTGKPWQALVEEHVLEPAGMSRTAAYASLPEKQGWQQAKPYFAFGENGPERIELEKQDNTMHAAGGMVSTASDLARWLILNLEEGKIEGRQIFPQQVLQNTHQKHAKADVNFFRFHRNGYGLGWYQATYDKETLIHHFGSFPGWRSHVSFMPEHDLGVAVLVNEGTLGSAYVDVISTFIYDWWLTGPEVREKYDGFVQRMVQEREQQKKQIRQGLAERESRMLDFSMPLASYEGTYINPLIGTIEIEKKEESLEVRLGNLKAIATPYTHQNTIRVELIPSQGEVIEFYVAEDNSIPFLQNNGMRFEREAQ